jgi:AAA15 family ATPase/GTPase
MTNEERKPIKLFIAYSSKDEELYKELESHLKKLKTSGHIDSWYERKIVGEEWDRVISDKLDAANIVLMLISPSFLVSDYFYEEEAKKVFVLYQDGKVELIPVILRDTNLGDTSFAGLEVLPSNGKAVTNPYWRDRGDAFKDIREGLLKTLKNIINPSEDISITQDKEAFPNCIKQLSIKNFQCIRRLILSEIPVDAQWVFITGENGDGKTALLQALCIGLLGNEDKEANDLLKKDPNTRIEIEFKQNSHNALCRFYKEKGNWKREMAGIAAETPIKIIGYGVTRLNIQAENIDEKHKKQNPAYSLYHETKGNFQNIEKWLKDEYLANKQQETVKIKEVKRVLKKLMPNIESIILEVDGVFYKEKGFKAEFYQISSGSKSIVAMVGDLLIRLFSLQPDVEKVSEFEGIVLIDELDLHMHPKWQKNLPGLLSEIFPGIQFWVTTHSIVPFMNAPANSVFFTLTRTEEGANAARLDIDMKNLLPNTLISSPLFGIEDFISPYADDFRTEYLYSDILKNKELNRKLEEAAKKFNLPKSFFDPSDASDL